MRVRDVIPWEPPIPPVTLMGIHSDAKQRMLRDQAQPGLHICDSARSAVVIETLCKSLARCGYHVISDAAKQERGDQRQDPG